MTKSLSVFQPAPFGLLEFTGPDRGEFLNRLLSNELILQTGQARSAYLLNVQGRPVAQFWVFQDATSSWLVCPQELVEVSLGELDKMHFGEKLQMFNRSADWKPQMLVGPGREDYLGRILGQIPKNRWSLAACPKGNWLLCRFPWLASGSDLLWSPTSLTQDLPGLTEAQFEHERILAGRPWPSDWGEKTMFLEIAEEHDYLDGKGCYPGQEVVARTLHRGHINRHLWTLRTAAPVAVKSKLLKDGKEVGWISAVSQLDGYPCLGFLRREVQELNLELATECGTTAWVMAPVRED